LRRAHGQSIPSSPRKSDSVELEERLRTYLGASGDPASLRARGPALAWLVAHAKSAEPRLRELLSPAAPAAPLLALDALVRIGSGASVPAIDALLREGNTEVSLAAARCLADHPSPRAVTALRKALRSNIGPAAISAVRVASLRLGASCIPALLVALESQDPDLRFHALRAVGLLGGISPARIQSLASKDPDKDVRRLARELSK